MLRFASHCCRGFCIVHLRNKAPTTHTVREKQKLLGGSAACAVRLKPLNAASPGSFLATKDSPLAKATGAGTLINLDKDPVAGEAAIKSVQAALKGKTLGQARTLLAAAHCSLGKVKKPKHHKGKLVVKSQAPKPGTVLPNGATVSVKLGPKPHHKKRH